MKNLNFVLEVSNGSWTILTLYFLVFLSIYLYLETVRRKVRLKDWIVGLPLGMVVAASLYVQNAGSLATRGVVWFWRHFDRGVVPLTDIEMIMLIVGSFIAAVGLLMMIRAFSRSQFGNWPWVSAAVFTAVYVVMTVSAHALS